MDRIVKFAGIILWLLVFITVVLSYAAVKNPGNVKLEDLCNEDNYSLQNMLDPELNRLLSGLNELRLSSKDADSTTRTNDLKWIDSCTGGVMVEMKSRSFEKKLQKPLSGSLDKR